MYKLIIKSAFASLMKRKVRTFLVIFMIASSLWGLLLMQGIYDGMTQQMINNAIRSDSSQLSIFAKNFRSQKDISLYIKSSKQIEEFLINEPNVKSFISRIVTSGLVATAKYSKNTSIYGIDVKDEIAHASLDGYIKQGEFNFGKKNRGAIIGFQLAKKLKVGIGKKIILSAQSIDNEVASISLKVTGIIKTNNMALDEGGIFINKEKAKIFLGLKSVNQISIMLNDYSKVDMLKTKLKTTFNDIEVFDWGELYPALLQTEQIMKSFSYISYVIVFFTATIGIFGVVLVSVLERLREFGVLRAIGTKFKIIVAMVFFESFFIGIIGLFLGSLIGGGTLYYFSLYGLDLSNFSDALDEFGMDAITYAVIKLEYFITAFIAVFSATFLSILVPLRVLKKSKPIEVING